MERLQGSSTPPTCTGKVESNEAVGRRSLADRLHTLAVRDGGVFMRVVGLFASIGGIELGLHAAGHDTSLLCELMPSAKAVLEAQFPDVPLVSDVRDIKKLPDAEIVCAGFPCQDLSQAGRTA